MNNFNNIDKNKMDLLIKTVSAKMGKSEAELRNVLESGKIDSILGGLDEEKKKKLTELINNPAQVEKLLSNPALRAVVNKYLK